MKKWTVIAGTVMALALVVITPVAVLAQPREGTVATDAARLRGILAIQSPRQATVGQTVTIRVIGPISREPVEGAGVWAFTRDEAKAIQEKIAGLRQSNADDATIQAAVQTGLDAHGGRIGTTDANGKVTHAFHNAGGYLLVAWKPGYWPAFQPIVVLGASRLMNIQAPFRARIGEPVTIRVTERRTGTPIEGAGVWAIPKDAIQGIKDKLSGLKQSAAGAADAAAIDAAVESELSARGLRIGTTDANGKLQYAFQQPGGRLLIAWKPGHVPAFRPILIVPPSTTPGSSANTTAAPFANP